MKEPDIEKINKKLAKESEGELVKLIQSKINNVKIRPRGSGALPPEKDLNMLERGTYRNNRGEDAEVPGYQILAKSPTVIFYKAIADNTIIIAVRGSVDSRDWLRTNTVLPLGRLTNTSRYKEDKKFVGDNLAKYAQGNDVYVVGHSLGGAIANQLQLDFPIIQGGLSFNPAFQPQDYFKKSNVHRKYTEGDPLGKLGRYLPGAEVEQNQNIVEKLIPGNPIKSAYSHFLENFESGKVPWSGVMGQHHKLSAFESGKDGGAKVVMDKKAYVKEHKKLIKLLEKAGKEGKEQKKELAKELKKGGMKIEGLVNFKNFYEYQKNKKHTEADKDTVKELNKYIDTSLPEKLKHLYPKIEIHVPIPKARQKKPEPEPPAPPPPPPRPPYVSPPPNLEFRDKIIKEIYDNPPAVYKYLGNPKLATDEKMILLGFHREGDTWYLDGKKIKRPQASGEGYPDGDLHAIIIKKKGYDKNDAVIEAAKFKTSKGLFMRETKLSYRFRNIPKTKFDPKSFRSKKINKNITLVYGKLK